MKIGIFGGSFNPIHNGHLLIAKEFLDLKIVDEVWLLPCYSHVWNKELAPASDRAKMIDLAIENLKIENSLLSERNLRSNQIENCKLEILQKRPMFTIDTVKLLKIKYPKHTFFWIIGSDNFKTLNKWHSYVELLDLIPFIIVPRTKDNYSSTTIRERLKKGLSIKKLVPISVEKYLLDNKLYN